MNSKIILKLGLNDGGSMCYFLEDPNLHKEISYQGGKGGLHGMGFDGNTNNNSYLWFLVITK